MGATSGEMTPIQVTDNSKGNGGIVKAVVLGGASDTSRVKISCGRVVIRLAPDTTAWMSWFKSKYESESTRGLSMRGLADLAANPRVGKKDNSSVAAPFYSSGKTGKHARVAQYGYLIVDLDEGNWSNEQVREQLGGLRYVAYMSSSSTAEKQKWKAVIPYSETIGYERHAQLALGVCKVMGGDPAQARIAQVFHLPNKLAKDSHYEYINTLDDEGCEWLDPEGDSEFLQYALIAWGQLEAERLAKQQKATPKSRDGLSEGDKGIVGLVNKAYTLEGLLEKHEYIEVGGKWLSPSSESGSPGVCLLTGDDGVKRVFSHHDEKDKLSALNHTSARNPNGHSLDVADVLCALEYDGDFSAMIAAQAVILDGVGNKERQREHMREKDRARLDPSLTDGYDVRPPDMTREDMLTDLVYIGEVDRISSLSNPNLSLPYTGARNYFASCTTMIGEDTSKPKQVKTIELWMNHGGRMTVAVRTFRAGAEPLCLDPNGKRALNSWRDFDYDESLIGADISPFLDHVYYLCGDKADMFLDWSAHAIQKPGELPHFGIVHISEATGKGRSTLGDFLANDVFRGYGVSGVDLSRLLKSEFNSIIAGKVLATVDEIKTGSKYDDKEAMKSLINAKTRIVNGKNEKQYVEFNACRWLIFSNHLDAVAIDETDRRFLVIEHTEACKSLEYYTALNAWCNDYRNAEAVRVWLKHRDISGFNPGERPPLDEAKLNAIAANKSEDAYIVEDIINDWGSDVIGSHDVRAAAVCRDHSTVTKVWGMR